MNFQPDTVLYLLEVPNFQINIGAQIGFFKTKEEQEAFFISKQVYKFDQLSYQRLYSGELNIEMNAEVLLSNNNINYLMYKNANYSNKWFFANILSTQYVNPNTTKIFYAVDSWQSFMFDIKLDIPSYIERRHWSGSHDNENSLMQLPFEDLDVGSDYIYNDRKFDVNDSLNSSYYKDQFYYILTTEPLKLKKSSHIVTPKYDTQYLDTSNGVSEIKSVPTQNGVNSVLEGYVLNYASLNWMIENDYFQECVTQNILQQVLLLPFGRSMFNDGLTNIANEVLGQTIADCEIYLQTDFGGLTEEKEIEEWCAYLNDYINRCISGNFDFSDGTVYVDAPSSAIGRYLYRYPYSLLEVYDFQNQPTLLQLEQLNRYAQLEYMTTRKLPIVKYGCVGSTPTLTHQIRNYKNGGYRPEQDLLNANVHSIGNEACTNQSTLNSMLALPIESDYLQAFLQSNINQIQASKMNALRSLQTDISNAGNSMQAGQTAISLGYSSATTQANTALQNAKISANTSLANAQVSNTMGAIGGIGQAIGTAFINPFAGVASGVGTAMSAYANTEISGNNFSASMNMANNSINSAYTVASNNSRAAQAQLQAGYANTLRSANTSYASTIRALNARVQDASNIPDSIQTQGNGGSYYNILQNRDMIMYSTKSITKEAMQRLIDYFCRYGFLTNRSESISSIFQKFEDAPGCYIKTVNATISGSIPMDNLQEIKMMFDAGVMMFHKNNYLDYDSMRGV